MKDKILEYKKMLIAVAGVVLPFLNQTGVPLWEFLTLEWLNTLSLVVTPVLVALVANKTPQKRSRPMVVGSPAPIGILTILLVLAALGGCASTQLEPAETFNDKAAYALSIQTAVLDTTTRALRYGEITVDEAEGVANIADDSRALIDAARRADDAGDAAGANRKIRIATSLLLQLQEYLRGNDE